MKLQRWQRDMLEMVIERLVGEISRLDEEDFRYIVGKFEQLEALVRSEMQERERKA